MKVLLLGHKGWIGQKVLNIFTNLNIDYLTTDLRGEDDNLKEFILNNNVTHIYCCLGRTHGILNDKVYTTIDYLENKETLHQNINDNLYTPLSLAMFSDKNNIHFTYIGTGRYYIPTFEKYLIENNIIMYDCLRQNETGCCEFLGCRKELFNEIFNILIEEVFIESVFKNRIEKYNNVLSCNKFEIEPTQQGGLNVIRTFL